MEITIKILQFIASFSLLILIHELGHFIFARMFGIRVEKFYLFFNPGFSLLKFKYKGTEYGIGWLPFGGYVKIAGMIDESMDTEQMAGPAQPDEFRSKPAWQRLLVMTGGVIMNVILAICIYIGMSYAWGDRYIANEDVTYGYVFNDLAHQIGFEDGDKIISVGGRTVENYASIYPEIIIGQAREVEVLRNGKTQTVYIPSSYTERMLDSPDFMEPRLPFVVAATVEAGGAERAGLRQGDSLVGINGEPLVYFDQYKKALALNSGSTVDIGIVRKDEAGKDTLSLPVQVSDEGTIGVYPYPLTAYVPIQTQNYSLGKAVPRGFTRAGEQLSGYWKQMKLIFKPDTGAYKSLGGIISIGSIFPGYWSWEVFWSITAFLSIVLAVMNMLPIPALDGGHVLFLLYEVITGRKPGDRFMEVAQMFGIVFILFLLIYATGNDIYRFFIK